MEQKIMVAMSGGVDSSVAAYLCATGHAGTAGITMRLYANEQIGLSAEHTCCSLQDVEDARSVATALGMPYYVYNFIDAFEQRVIEPFIAAYERGDTPNPCIDCNRYLKFDLLLKRAELLEFSHVATGHYGRVQQDGSGRYLLKKALDETKDQSYVLWTLTQQQLAHLLLPVGALRKSEVREIAQTQGFCNAKKHDSQDICFVPDGDYAAFIERTVGRPAAAGDFVDESGAVLGRHRGLIRYTIGQRKGLGISGQEPLYVCGKNALDNTVTLGHEPALYRRTLTAHQINLIATQSLEHSCRVWAKVRYRQTEQPAMVQQTGEDTLQLIFDEPQRAVTSGQSVVLYDGDTVIGGGIIAP